MEIKLANFILFQRFSVKKIGRNVAYSGQKRKNTRKNKQAINATNVPTCCSSCRISNLYIFNILPEAKTSIPVFDLQDRDL
jgi:hypothetical protein